MQRLRLFLASVALLWAVPVHAQSYTGSETIVSIVPRIDVTCILKTWRIKGVRICIISGQPTPCVIVENAYPVGIIESVKHPYASHLKEVELLLKGLKGIVPTPKDLKDPLGSSASHTGGSSPGSSLQYGESRAFMFVPSVSAGLPIAVPPISGYGVAYVSELDRYGYRNPFIDALLKPRQVASSLPSCDTRWATQLSNCSGTWGAFYPRVGYVNHPSTVIAAYLQGLRAGRIAHDPMGHIVLGRYPYEPRTGHYLQPVRPSSRQCFTIGSPAVLKLERGAGSRTQEQLLIHFGIFEQCVPCWGSRLVPARSPK